MTGLQTWVKLPTSWIERHGLRPFQWKNGQGPAATAALMVLAALAHHADATTGICRRSYDDLTLATDISRAKVAAGLTFLETQKIVSRWVDGRGSYKLNDFDPSRGWGKFPAKLLYKGSTIAAFKEFHLRRPTELDALKAYFLFVSRRDNEKNFAHLSYEKIEEYAGISRQKIKSAISLLAACGLVHVETVPSKVSGYGVSNAYRIAHIDPYNHNGTRGRSEQ
jgi:biotin operon repressor